MDRLIVPPEMRARFAKVVHSLELCDGAGQTIGRFVPEDEYRHLLWAYANSDPTAGVPPRPPLDLSKLDYLTSEQVMEKMRKLAEDRRKRDGQAKPDDPSE